MIVDYASVVAHEIVKLIEQDCNTCLVSSELRDKIAAVVRAQTNDPNEPMGPRFYNHDPCDGAI